MYDKNFHIQNVLNYAMLNMLEVIDPTPSIFNTSYSYSFNYFVLQQTFHLQRYK